MAARSQTYAIRIAVEGGGQVKAELVTVGQSGEQSLKRIESAGQRASGGLTGLGRQAELLRTGIRTLGGALTVGGLGALIDRSISAADAIGKTADKIGVGVEVLQELRFAEGVRRRAADARGEAKDALAQMGIALRRPTPASCAASTAGAGASQRRSFNGHIALIACFASSWTPAMVRRWHGDPFGFLRSWNELPALFGSAPPGHAPSTGTGVVVCIMGSLPEAAHVR
jgi:hypothetical protein